jgi:hypothetical protein
MTLEGSKPVEQDLIGNEYGLCGETSCPGVLSEFFAAAYLTAVALIRSNRRGDLEG